MNKRAKVGLVSAGILLFGAIGSSTSNQSTSTQSPNPGTLQATKTIPIENTQTKAKVEAVCDGTSVTANCTHEGVKYKTYIYHAATPEKSHIETQTTYREEVTGHCTLCNDGTYSPSCATGRGACSHHGGVAEWNAQRTSRVPTNSPKTVVDTPAQAAYYEKILN